MKNVMLNLLGNNPLVFGVQCPWCAKDHLIASLGAGVETPEGKQLDIPPTLGLIGIDKKSNKGTVKCWECHRVFQIKIQVLIPDDLDDVDVN